MVDVSFIITNYNYDHFIEECIRSCIYQHNTKLSYEVIVADDGSTDNSIKKIMQYKNCKLIRNKNMGVEKAANLAVSCAVGEYVVRVDADDMVSPFYLCKIQENLTSDIDVLYGNYTEIDDLGQKLGAIKLPDFNSSEILERGDFLATGTLYRKSAIMQFGPYNTIVKNNGLENYELIIQLLKSKKKFAKITAHLFYYRHHNMNMSMIRHGEILKYGQKIFSENDLGDFRIGEFHPYMKRVTK